MQPIISFKHKILWAGLFGIAMGYFEAALVEYLRLLYYPQGFSFPLREVPLNVILIELGREIASILMLAAVAALLGSSFIDRFAGFAYIFGVWDIAYYVFLKIFENWPSSLFTTDVLFLIPLPWIGPVWAPIGVSVTLIGASCVIWIYLDKGIQIKPTLSEWIGEITAGLIIILSFLDGAPEVLRQEPPPPFRWYAWLFGMALGLVIFLRALHRTRHLGRL